MNVKNTTTNENKTVLYIEDNPANLRLVMQLLERIPNLNTLSAVEPNAGIALAEKYIPNLILLDINLPGINGYDVLEILKKSEKISKIPVIAISANAMPNDLEKGKSAGFADYVTKPINVKILLESVKNVLGCQE